MPSNKELKILREQVLYTYRHFLENLFFFKIDKLPTDPNKTKVKRIWHCKYKNKYEVIAHPRSTTENIKKLFNILRHNIIVALMARYLPEDEVEQFLGKLDNKMIAYKAIANLVPTLKLADHETASDNIEYLRKKEIDDLLASEITEAELSNIFYYKNHLIPYLPEEFKTRKHMINAVSVQFANIKYVPEEFIDKEFYLEVVKIRPTFINSIPQEFVTQEMCKAAVKEKYSIFNGLKTEFKTPELLQYAIEHDYEALRLETIDFIGKDFIISLVSRNWRAFRYLKKEQRLNKNNLDICLAAIRTDGRALEYIPPKLRTYEMCKLALQSSSYAIEFVPERFLDEYGDLLDEKEIRPESELKTPSTFCD